MRVAILVGNSRCRVARVSGRGERRIEAFRWSGDGLSELPALLRGEAPETLLVASVRDDLLDALLERLPSTWPAPLVARRDLPIPIENRYEPPTDVGTDRLLNAIAARELFPGRPALAVDFGSALSLSVVDREGAFVGGLIAVGATGLLESLAQRTPRLPRPSIASLVPGRAIERSTEAAVTSGLARQFIGGVRALVRAIVAELGEDAGVVATGGEAEFFAAEIPEIDRVEEHLTLDGLLRLDSRRSSS